MRWQESHIAIRLRLDIHIRRSVAERSCQICDEHTCERQDKRTKGRTRFLHKYPAIPPGLTVNSGFGDRSLVSREPVGCRSKAGLSDGIAGDLTAEVFVPCG